MKRLSLVATFAVLVVAGCAGNPETTGPLAAGVPRDAPKDTIGEFLTWTPEQTLENFKHLDRLFPTRPVRRGATVKQLPQAERQLDLQVTLEGETLGIDAYMVKHRITGVLALKHGKIVLERYALGRTAEDRWVSMSAAKSVTSTLIGAAIKEGLIGSVNDPVTRYIPELAATPAFDNVKLVDLMTMSGGLKWNENYQDLRSDVALAGGGEVVNGVPPLVAYAQKLERDAPPGTKNAYHNIDADLVGIALARALKGKTVSDYLSEKIWAAYGMESDANWLLDKAGIERGGCCLSITLRDYARLGLFIHEGGKAGGRDVLPEGWIKQATAARWPFSDAGSGYGWFWWIRSDTGYEALGAYGQSVTIYPYPEDDLVIAINAASVNVGGIGFPRWQLLWAIAKATEGW